MLRYNAIVPFFCITLAFIPFASNASSSKYTNHGVGFSYGKGKPNKLHGYRFNYRYRALDFRALTVFADVSYARWSTNSSIGKNVHIFAAAPAVRLGAQLPIKSADVTIFIEGSLGIARKSNRYHGDNLTGSLWTFQDIVGFGIAYNHFDIRIQYLHYSNASLARPNPGIDVKPLLTLTYTL